MHNPTPTNTMTTIRTKPTLLPAVEYWNDDYFMFYNLRYGPESTDPNQAMEWGVGEEYVHGWYDDNRVLSFGVFVRAMERVRNFDREMGVTEAMRRSQARRFWNTPSRLAFLREIRQHLNEGTSTYDFRDEIIEIMVRDHLHYWHRFRMIPVEVVRSWNVTTVTDAGMDILADFPQRLRSRGP